MAVKPFAAVATISAALALGACISSAEPEAVSAATDGAVRQAGQAETFAMTKEMKASPTGYGGSIPVQKLDTSPELRTLFAGSGFAKDYKEDRGHEWAWIDLKESGRLNEKTPGSCMACKTPYVSQAYKESGWAFAARPVREFMDVDHPTISCETCHDPKSGKLTVIQPGFVESLKERTIEFDKLGASEQKTMTCAQCHVEYYFVPQTNRIVHPLGWGSTAEEMYEYYATRPNGFAADFVHPESGAQMLKTQHPDYEEFLGGIHAHAGLSCSDCHMPEGSHHIASPLLTVEKTCLKCHEGRTADWMISRVRYNQDAVAALQTQCGQDLARTHRLVGEKAKTLPPEILAEAREGLREAQWYWDYVAAANSMGAHNPVGALGNLAKAGGIAARVREMVLSGVKAP